MNFLFLDLSTKSTGYAISDDKGKLITYGLLTASSSNNINSKSIEFMQASEWRKNLGIKTGRGIKRENLKPLDIKYVKDTYGIDANDDVCDAICLYTAYFKS